MRACDKLDCVLSHGPEYRFVVRSKDNTDEEFFIYDQFLDIFVFNKEFVKLSIDQLMQTIGHC